MDESLLKREERAVFSLRSLYKSYGYLPYKMSKFEEYELYSKNKDFLVSDSVITFNDIGGKLLALKPDVTLSIVKQSVFEPGIKTKYCYNENVYRVSPRTHRYSEILQAGIECIGDLDDSDTVEVILLALESLAKLGTDFVLDISHVSILSGILADEMLTDEEKKSFIKYVSEKNTHEIKKLCAQNNIREGFGKLLSRIAMLSGSPEEVLAELDTMPLCMSGWVAYDQLVKIWSIVKETPFASHLRFDFSVIDDMNYYDGIVMSGWVEGVPERILSGGQYTKLLRRNYKMGDAIGFAVYLDLLDYVSGNESKTDVDVLILYNKDADTAALLRRIKEIQQSGKSVTAMKAIPSKLRYGEIEVFGGENNA